MPLKREPSQSTPVALPPDAVKKIARRVSQRIPRVESKQKPERGSKGSWHSFAAGGISGTIDALITMPLDTIKVQMQCDSKLRNPFHAAVQIIRRDPKSFYAGVQPFVLQCAGKAAIRFFAFEKFKYILGPTSPGTDLTKYVGHTGLAMMSGLGAGISEAVIWTAPMERLKVLRQTEATMVNVKGSGGLLSTAIKIIQTQGFVGLYRGCLATCLRQGSSHMTRFAIYTPIRNFLLVNTTDRKLGAPSPAWVSMTAGGLAGSLSVCLNNPVDVVKSRIQAVGSKETGIISCARSIIKNEGIASFFNGLSARVPRLFFSQAITFTVYERALSSLLDISE